MTKLSVNINKFATLRNARGGNNPDVRQAAIDCVRFGAEGITVHPRPDERHIRRSDVYEIADAIAVEFNIEGYPSEDFLKLVEQVKPAQCTLVPDPPGVLTSNAGWDTLTHRDFLRDTIARLHASKVRTSIFLGTDLKLVDGAKETGTDRIELYTEPYAAEYPKDHVHAIAPFIRAARHAHLLGLGLNAGHDLSLENLRYFKENILHLQEVSIGHALVCDALYMGLEKTIQSYLGCLK
ncbi:MAG: pyridoxine 5'-phosphate synthase [Bacteroidetes bacterium]|jgi:pyridoxine 5-phosphate synthase|nr:pyridoxine 5'-phosphate synthase [Bacteroidota bacterium]MBL0015058.1 pyridoxine 5'-phosphate synthase [Bacteroidota bacterium]MBP6638738.1 pyridoxine 5'-phosphate synthase [Bacteroidia bacterium]MBP8073790.1 pyridoxine 5'-phosphate synthase [Bacteroidia bacterium]